MIEARISDESRRPWYLAWRRRLWVLSLPESWAELGTLRRRARWWRWALTLGGMAAQRAMLRDCLRPLPKRVRQQLSDLDMAAFVQQLGWAQMSPKCDHVPVPEFTLHGQRYLMPQPKGANVSCIEFALADEFYTQFMDQQDERATLLLLATLAREAEPDEATALRRGDNRLPLHTREEVDARATQLAGADPELLTQALLYFSGLKNFVHDIYGEWLFETDDVPDDDDDDEDEQPTARRKAPAEYPNFGWWGIFQQVAEGGVFGHHVNDVHAAFFHDVCVYLVRKRVEARQQKDALADARRKPFNSD